LLNEVKNLIVLKKKVTPQTKDNTGNDAYYRKCHLDPENNFLPVIPYSVLDNDGSKNYQLDGNDNPD